MGKKVDFVMPSIAWKPLPVCSFAYTSVFPLGHPYPKALGCKTLRIGLIIGYIYHPCSAIFLANQGPLGTASCALTCGATSEADDTQIFWSRRLEGEAQGLTYQEFWEFNRARLKFGQKKTYHRFPEVLFAYSLHEQKAKKGGH